MPFASPMALTLFLSASPLFGLLVHRLGSCHFAFVNNSVHIRGLCLLLFVVFPSFITTLKHYTVTWIKMSFPVFLNSKQEEYIFQKMFELHSFIFFMKAKFIALLTSKIFPLQTKEKNNELQLKQKKMESWTEVRRLTTKILLNYTRHDSKRQPTILSLVRLT